jgi:hypothetical protein
MPALQAQSPKFKPSSTKRKKKIKKERKKEMRVGGMLRTFPEMSGDFFQHRLFSSFYEPFQCL